MDSMKPRRMRNRSVELAQAARALRERPTPQEELLWDALRLRRLDGLRFRRQYAVERFVLDFYCPRCKLVVEVDGPVHATQTSRDAERDAHLTAFGCRVLRFTNQEIEEDLAGVLQRIARAALERLPGGQPGANPKEDAEPED